LQRARAAIASELDATAALVQLPVSALSSSSSSSSTAFSSLSLPPPLVLDASRWVPRSAAAGCSVAALRADWRGGRAAAAEQLAANAKAEAKMRTLLHGYAQRAAQVDARVETAYASLDQALIHRATFVALHALEHEAAPRRVAAARRDAQAAAELEATLQARYAHLLAEHEAAVRALNARQADVQVRVFNKKSNRSCRVFPFLSCSLLRLASSFFFFLSIPSFSTRTRARCRRASWRRRGDCARPHILLSQENTQTL
jgi:hypothetical protein